MHCARFHFNPPDMVIINRALVSPSTLSRLSPPFLCAVLLCCPITVIEQGPANVYVLRPHRLSIVFTLVAILYYSRSLVASGWW